MRRQKVLYTMWLKKEALFQLVTPIINYNIVLIEVKGDSHEYPLH